MRVFTRSATPDFSFSHISYGRPRAEILVNHQINFLSPTYPAPLSVTCDFTRIGVMRLFQSCFLFVPN